MTAKNIFKSILYSNVELLKKGFLCDDSFMYYKWLTKYFQFLFASASVFQSWLLHFNKILFLLYYFFFDLVNTFVLLQAAVAGTILIQNIGGERLRVHCLCINVMTSVSSSCFLPYYSSGWRPELLHTQVSSETFSVVLITLSLFLRSFLLADLVGQQLLNLVPGKPSILVLLLGLQYTSTALAFCSCDSGKVQCRKTLQVILKYFPSTFVLITALAYTASEGVMFPGL